MLTELLNILQYCVFGLVLVIATGIALLYARYRQNVAKFAHIPGVNQFLPPILAQFWPKSLYFLYKPVIPEFRQWLSASYEELYKKHGPIFKVVHAHMAVVMLTDPEASKLLSKQSGKLFVKNTRFRPNVVLENLNASDVFLEHDETIWQRHRRLLEPAFTPDALRSVLTVTSRVCDALEAKIEKGLSSDPSGFSLEAVNEMSLITLDVIGKAGFGHEFRATAGGDDDLAKLTSQIFNSFMWFFIVPTKFLRKHINIGPMKTLHEGFEKFKVAIKQIIAREQNNTDGKNILGLLLHNAQNDSNDELKPLTKDELVSNSFVALVAGHETTARTACFALYLLATNPSIQRKAQQVVDDVLRDSVTGKYRDPEFEDLSKLHYLDLIMRETLRLFPTAGEVFRTALAPFEFKGYTVPGLSGVVFGWNPMNRDEKYFSNPEDFRPERFDEKYNIYVATPFGMGSRQCLGKTFAKFEFITVLVRLLAKYDMSLADPSYKMIREVAITMKPKYPLNIKFTHRQ